MFIVLLGAPGSGKGTVGKIIAEDLKLAHISTGDLFRENIKNETELGKKAKEYIDNFDFNITGGEFYSEYDFLEYEEKIIE